jgi:hypothetical protein
MSIIRIATRRSILRWIHTSYPNPRLAIEIDISRSNVDGPGIYAALKNRLP